MPILSNLLFECGTGTGDIIFRIRWVVLLAGAVILSSFSLAVGHQPDDLFDPVGVGIEDVPLLFGKLLQPFAIALDFDLWRLPGNHGQSIYLENSPVKDEHTKLYRVYFPLN